MLRMGEKEANNSLYCRRRALSDTLEPVPEGAENKTVYILDLLSKNLGQFLEARTSQKRQH